MLSESLIRKIEQQYPINKSANPIITWERTLSVLEVKAHSKLKSLFSDLLLRRQATLLDEITSLRNSMLLHCSLAGVIVLGERLRE